MARGKARHIAKGESEGRESIERNEKRTAEGSATSAKLPLKRMQGKEILTSWQLLGAKSEGISYLARDLTPVPVSLRLVG